MTMTTAEEFAAETERRRMEIDECRRERIDALLKEARPKWPELAALIEKEARWHLRESKVNKESSYGALGIRSTKDNWSDVEEVVRLLAAENGFELKTELDITPSRWIFTWPRKE